MQHTIVLCLDEDEVLLHMLEATLTANNYTVLTVSNSRQALNLAAMHRLDAAILDYGVPGMSGGEVASEIKRITPDTSIIVFSGAHDIPSSALLHVDGLVQKGEGVNALHSTLHRLLHRAGATPLASRRFPRYSVKLPFSVVTARSGKLEMVRGVSTSISEGGIGGTIDGSLVLGDRVLIYIAHEQTELRLESRAQVCYQKPDGCGFAFLDVPPPQKGSVRQFCQQLASHK